MAVIQITSILGLLPNIASICSIISSVIFGSTSSAFKFCNSCAGEDTPRMTVEVLGSFATHARASAVAVDPSPKMFDLSGRVGNYR